MAPHSRLAYATLLTRNEYLPGVLVLNHGLRSVKSRYPLVVMTLPSLSNEARDVLELEGMVIREVERLEAKNTDFTTQDKRFNDTWTKIRYGFYFSTGQFMGLKAPSVWDMLEYERVVLLDCDMIVRRNMDELLDTLILESNQVAAAHVCACNPRKIPHYPKDWIPMNCAHSAVKSPTAPPPKATPSSPRPYHQLNSGLVVLRPSRENFDKLCHHLHNDPEVPTFIFPDQDLINKVFHGSWEQLPWYYNALRTLRNIHPALWSEDEIRCLHYILADKPWQSRLMVQDGAFGEVNQWWWNAYDEMAKRLKQRDPDKAGFISRYVDCDEKWRP